MHFWPLPNVRQTPKSLCCPVSIGHRVIAKQDMLKEAHSGILDSKYISFLNTVFLVCLSHEVGVRWFYNGRKWPGDVFTPSHFTVLPPSSDPM